MMLKNFQAISKSVTNATEQKLEDSCSTTEAMEDVLENFFETLAFQLIQKLIQ